MEDLLEVIYQNIGICGMSIRECSRNIGVSKSWVHYLIHHNLKKYSKCKYYEVVAVLDLHRTRC